MKNWDQLYASLREQAQLKLLSTTLLLNTRRERRRDVFVHLALETSFRLTTLIKFFNFPTKSLVLGFVISKSAISIIINRAFLFEIQRRKVETIMTVHIKFLPKLQISFHNYFVVSKLLK